MIGLNDGLHSAVVIEVDENRDNVQIINWHYLDAKTLAQKGRQAIREGGLILTLSKDNAVANTPNYLTTENKDSKQSEENKENDVKTIANEADTNLTEVQIVAGR